MTNATDEFFILLFISFTFSERISINSSVLFTSVSPKQSSNRSLTARTASISGIDFAKPVNNAVTTLFVSSPYLFKALSTSSSILRDLPLTIPVKLLIISHTSVSELSILSLSNSGQRSIFHIGDSEGVDDK